MEPILSNDSVKGSLDNQLLYSINKLLKEKEYLDISLNELLKHSNISKKIFYRYYRNQFDLLNSINNSFVEDLKNAIPFVESEKDIEYLTNYLLEVINSDECMNKLKLIFKMNRGIKLDYFITLEKRIFHLINSKMAYFFEKLIENKVCVSFDGLEVLYFVIEESLLNDRKEPILLVIYSLKATCAIFD